MQELNKTNSDLRFYHSKFPMCDGVTYEHWTYEYHRNFELNADYMAEYVLHINDGQARIHIASEQTTYVIYVILLA